MTRNTTPEMRALYADDEVDAAFRAQLGLRLVRIGSCLTGDHYRVETTGDYCRTSDEFIQRTVSSRE